ncbi:P83/100 family protein [Borrelia miyamotoi]|uniref:P83/100 family protein n=1 Tax=Borrelia miyamotoi TaxID=47466 RepID=A0AAX3JLV6_9SPIR|nr:P83/100 family protein [Borrelia miyamotoi]WAZ71543.1 P83/100 family protein [Borrelia miyamotoi]
MKVIRIVFMSLFIFLNVFTFNAREVDKKRLKDFVNMDLEFVNYLGPYDSTDTYQEIVGIGEFLAKNLTNNKSNYYKKYYVNRYIESNDEKSSSDVFLISESSSLDSILNLRRILTGYLMGAFNYSKDSAALLAKAITIYNAVYRGDLDYYSDAYIQPAIEGLSKDNVGLSRVYSQWAGKTCIFIPFKRNILSGGIESEVDLDKIVTEKVVGALLNENEEIQTDFARELTDVQDEIRDFDQDKVDIESDTLKSINDELTETLDNLREQLNKAADDIEKENIKKQLDEKMVDRDALNNKASGLEKSQKKLDNSQKKLDKQRDAVKNKIQENLEKENKDKNLPKPGEINSPKVDEKLQLTEAIDNLREQLNKAADDIEKENIKKQIDEKMVDRDALNNKASGLEKSQKKLDNSQKKLDKQRDAVKNKIQENLEKENKDKNLPKPGEINSPKVDEKLQLTKTVKDLKKQLEKATSDVPNRTPSIINNKFTQSRSPDKPLDSKVQLDQLKDISKLPLKDENHKSVFLEIINPNTNLGVLRFIDSDEDKLIKTVKTSQIKTSQYGVRRYGFYERDDDFVVIRLCSGVAKLQLLSKSENLKIKSEAGFDLSRDSSLFVDSRMILVVVKDNNVWKLAKFSPKDLSKFVLSEDEIFPFTSFTVDTKHVYLQDSSKNIIALDLNSLKKKL